MGFVVELTHPRNISRDQLLLCEVSGHTPLKTDNVHNLGQEYQRVGPENFQILNGSQRPQRRDKAVAH